MSLLKNKKIVLGVTGSIAAYKSPLLVRELVKEGAAVNVVMTPSATNFATPLALENLSKNPVAVGMFDESVQAGGAWHIQLAHWCDLMIIAPCSATTLGKLAHGICDSALVAVATALPGDIPFIVSPAMDSTMWLNPATQRNAMTLENDGAIIIPPEEGELASGITGPGRMPEIDEIMKYISDSFDVETSPDDPEIEITTENKKKDINKAEEKTGDDNTIEVIFEKKKETKKTYEQALREALDTPAYSLEDAVAKQKWDAELEFTKMKNEKDGAVPQTDIFKGKKVLITAGPTYEKIDDVRFIGNYSSGKMGYSLAGVASELGADVTLVSGPVNIKAPKGINVKNVESAEEMYDAVISEFDKSDYAILSAAVADYSPKNRVEGKIKKMDTGNNMSIELKSTKDILASLGKIKNEKQKLIGFALESSNEIENGWKKLQAKNCDMIVVNSANKPQSGFKGDDNTIMMLTTDGKQKNFGPAPKYFCARAIFDRLAEISGK